jgi:hypothetical protein
MFLVSEFAVNSGSHIAAVHRLRHPFCIAAPRLLLRGDIVTGDCIPGYAKVIALRLREQ